MYQLKYWKEMYQLKVHINYVEMYLSQSERYDRYLNIFLAATSSGSICGWAIWRDYSIFWGGIIAASQLVQAIKEFIPFKSRIKPLSGLLLELEDQMLMAEKNWFNVSEGNLTEEEIHNLQFKIRGAKTKSLQKYLPTSTLPDNFEILEEAQRKADIYFSIFYP